MEKVRDLYNKNISDGIGMVTWENCRQVDWREWIIKMILSWVIDIRSGVIGIGVWGLFPLQGFAFSEYEGILAIKEMTPGYRPEIKKSGNWKFWREAHILAHWPILPFPRYLIILWMQQRFSGSGICSRQRSRIDVMKTKVSSGQPGGWLGVEICDVLSYLHNHTPEPIIFSRY